MTDISTHPVPDIKDHFETMPTLPETTRVKVTFRTEPKFMTDSGELRPHLTEIVEIPTSEIVEKGDWISRRFSGIKFPLIEKVLDRRNVTCYPLRRWVEVLKD